MATKKTVKKSAPKKSAKKGVGPAAAATGAALAAAAVAAGASYYFYGTANAKRHRQAAATWAKGMKRDVEKGVKSLKKIDSKTVARIVDEAAATYQGVRGVAATDVREAAHELKRNWNVLKREMAPSSAVTKTVKKTVKKAVKDAKKVVKKVTPKKTAKRK